LEDSNKGALFYLKLLRDGAGVLLCSSMSLQSNSKMGPCEWLRLCNSCEIRKWAFLSIFSSTMEILILHASSKLLCRAVCCLRCKKEKNHKSILLVPHFGCNMMQHFHSSAITGDCNPATITFPRL
jgi:hypothetical protein